MWDAHVSKEGLKIAERRSARQRSIECKKCLTCYHGMFLANLRPKRDWGKQSIRFDLGTVDHFVVDWGVQARVSCLIVDSLPQMLPNQQEAMPEGFWQIASAVNLGVTS